MTKRNEIDVTDLYLAELVRVRDEALLSLDVAKIRAYADRYGVELPDNDRDFWVGIHIARINLPTMPSDVREASMQWLRDNGYAPYTTESF